MSDTYTTSHTNDGSALAVQAQLSGSIEGGAVIELAAISHAKAADTHQAVEAHGDDYHGADKHKDEGWFTAENVVGFSVILFLALVFLKAGKSITRMLDARGQQVRAQLKQAQDLKEKASELLADVKRKREQAEQDVAAILASAKREAQQAREKADKELELSLQRRERAAAERIAQAEFSAINDVKNKAIDLATRTAALVLGKALTGKAGEAFNDEALTKLKAQLN